MEQSLLKKHPFEITTRPPSAKIFTLFNPSTKNAPPFARCFVDQGGDSWHSVGWDACLFTTTNTEWISGVRLMNYGSGHNLCNGRITVYGYRY